MRINSTDPYVVTLFPEEEPYAFNLWLDESDFEDFNMVKLFITKEGITIDFYHSHKEEVVDTISRTYEEWFKSA